MVVAFLRAFWPLGSAGQTRACVSMESSFIEIFSISMEMAVFQQIPSESMPRSR